MGLDYLILTLKRPNSKIDRINLISISYLNATVFYSKNNVFKAEIKLKVNFGL